MAFGWIGIVAGAFLILLGAFMVFVFPNKPEHQTEGFGIVGIILGFIFLIAGGLLIFK